MFVDASTEAGSGLVTGHSLSASGSLHVTAASGGCIKI